MMPKTIIQLLRLVLLRLCDMQLSYLRVLSTADVKLLQVRLQFTGVCQANVSDRK